MTQKYSIFSYKKGSSPLHTCPCQFKLIFIPILNILFLCLPIEFSIALIIIQFTVAFLLKFSLKEQLTDLKPALYYAIILFFIQILTCIFNQTSDFKTQFSWQNQKENIFILLKIFCIMQSSSLIFKTSTSLEIREGIFKIESRIRKIFHLKQNSTFTDTISMFINFIPLVSKIFEQSKKAYIARGGKTSIKMYMKLLPILFSVGMKKAFNTARAISMRK